MTPLAAHFVIAVASCGLALACASPVQQTPDTAPAPIEFDCTDSPECPELVIAAAPDGEPQSPWRGMADPAIRADANSGQIFLSYTFVSSQRSGSPRPDISVGNHLASSADGGTTWTFAALLWPSTTEINPVTSLNGFSGHEVSALWSDDDGWWGTHLRFHDPEGNGNNRRSDSFRLEYAQAASPTALAQATPTTVAGTLADDAWNVDYRLSSLSPDLAECTLWLDPLVFSDAGRHYLMALCVVYRSGVRVPEAGFYGVFALEQGAPRWLGMLGDGTDAANVGAQELSKGKLARARDGALLFLVAPVLAGPMFEEYRGCYVFEVATIDPPRLRRDENGVATARVIVRSSDSVPTSGSCAYDPNSESGILLTRRELRPELGEFLWSIHATGVHP